MSQFGDTIFLKTQVDVLSFFNEDQLRRVTPDIERSSYDAGQVVMLKGEISAHFYIIKAGKVVAAGKTKEGPFSTELAKGDFFGEISLIDNAVMDTTVKALEAGTEILMIPSQSFQKLLEMQPLLKKTLLDKAAARKAAPKPAA
ncbi:MAG: cyclic nucleotide-binding domain-containing protein [Elusimicrobia bacterium]|nr:cyclic nucleotide-binding domain-containing protein [Elusimicrobiota bacterium]